jgi:hypothetical protein
MHKTQLEDWFTRSLELRDLLAAKVTTSSRMQAHVTSLGLQPGVLDPLRTALQQVEQELQDLDTLLANIQALRVHLRIAGHIVNGVV